MRTWRAVALFLLASLAMAQAQFDGPGSPGVSASLIRLFGTNTAFTAQVEYQLLNRSNKELVSLPMSFARLDNRIRVEIDLAKMKNQVQPDALAQIKPLGMDQLVTVLRPDQQVTYQVFPRLKAFVKLPMPPAEIDSFLKPAKMERTSLGTEKMQGFTCTKYRVVAYDGQGKRHEATAWNAPELRNFPVCVATKEGTETAVMRFRQVMFNRSEAAKFEPPAGFEQCSDMQALMAGPVTRYMVKNKTTTNAPAKSSPPSPARKKK
ncbi:MAG TPA: hypothetical protein VFZ59_27380 [Verrucomicrobiae bacterium]|nr:hypothetical protein [Verrucomicrobiae bacterium]